MKRQALTNWLTVIDEKLWSESPSTSQSCNAIDTNPQCFKYYTGTNGFLDITKIKRKEKVNPIILWRIIGLYETAIYYIEEIYDEKNGKQFYDVIWEKDIASGVQKKLLQGDEHSFESFKIINGRLFAVDENLGSLVVKNLSTGQVSTHQFSENVYPAYIIPKMRIALLLLELERVTSIKSSNINLKKLKSV